MMRLSIGQQGEFRKIFMAPFLLAIIITGSCTHKTINRAAEHDRTIVPSYDIIKISENFIVYHFPEPRVPIFKVALSFKRGATNDPVGKSGLAAFTGNLLTKGVGGRDENLLSQRFDDLAGSIGVSVGEFRQSLNVSGLNSKLEPLMDEFLLAATDPDFSPIAFDRVRRNAVDRLKRLSDMPDGLASRAFFMILMSESRRWRPISGLLKDIQSIKANDLKDSWKKTLLASHKQALVIGGTKGGYEIESVLKRLRALNVTSKELVKPVDQPRAVQSPAWLRDLKGKVVLIDLPDLKDVIIRAGYVGPSRKDKYFHSLEVAETALGGYFNSRLVKELRERQGLTYSVSAEFSYMGDNSVFHVTTSTSPNKLARLLLALTQELKLFSSGSYKEEEIEAAKAYVTGSFPVMLSDKYTTAGLFFDTIEDGLDEQFLDHYAAGVAAVKHQDVLDAIALHVTKKQLTYVIVGDAKIILPQIKAAKMNVITVRGQDFE